jgi:dTDP-D-glucose 4,6-dehydratase
MYGRSLYFDVGRAKRELGWQSRWSNEEAICESYDWYLAHRDEVAAGSGSPHRSGVRQGILAVAKRFF